ncbi:MAG: TMEM175 family protein [Gemmatirosa sp.]
MIRQHLVKAHPERDGDFRWRGDGVSRIEGLSDAVFGFAVTLLVISLEAPRTFTDLLTMTLGLPAFAATFSLLVLVWFAQYRFFRRYGMEDRHTIVLNVVLLFVVLFYIYPLKFLFQTFIGLTIGFVGWKGDIDWMQAVAREPRAALRPDQWPAVMCVYAVGWCALYALFALMHRHALVRRDELGLDELEVLMTRYTIYEQAVMIGVGLLSMVVTLVLAYGLRLSPVLAGIGAGWTYFLIWPLQVVQGRRLQRRKRELRATVAPAEGAAVAATGA